jgi:hypothetical protein
MADELTVSGNVTFIKGSTSVSFGKTGLTFDVSGTKHVHVLHTVGTSEEALLKGDVATPGLLAIYNRDATNYATYRPASAGADTVKILPGEPAIFRCATTSPYLVANTAPVDLEYLLIEA